MEGSLNSEARKRQQEARGEAEPRLLTEHHPVYAGDLFVEQAVVDTFDRDMEAMRISEVRADIQAIQNGGNNG